MTDQERIIAQLRESLRLLRGIADDPILGPQLRQRIVLLEQQVEELLQGGGCDATPLYSVRLTLPQIEILTAVVADVIDSVDKDDDDMLELVAIQMALEAARVAGRVVEGR